MTELQYKDERRVFQEKEKDGVFFLAFEKLEQTGLVNHGFSTRLGGVSTGPFASMNFTLTQGDDPAAVAENYRRMAKALGVDEKRMVISYQTHTTNIRLVTDMDAGKGLIRERDYSDVDGLITNCPGITLVTFYADCVPLYFLDPKKKAIGLSHSGWKGTAADMAGKTVEAMKQAFGTHPEDLIVGIGPSICQDCYEVSSDVAEQFQKAFPEVWHKELLTAKAAGKYQLDLWRANELLLRNAGVRREQIAVSNLCTCCNSSLLFSHRASKGKRGNLGAFLSLR